MGRCAVVMTVGRFRLAPAQWRRPWRAQWTGSVRLDPVGRSCDTSSPCIDGNFSNLLATYISGGVVFGSNDRPRRFVVFLSVIATTTLVVAGCGASDETARSGGSTTSSSSSMASDDDMVRALYREFAAAAKSGDASHIRELTCPHLRVSNDATAWIKDADGFRDAAGVQIETLSGPKGEDVDSPMIQAWKLVDRIAVAKIDDHWYVCEH